MRRKQSSAHARTNSMGSFHATAVYPPSTWPTQGHSGQQWWYHCAQWNSSGCRQLIPGLLSYRFVHIYKYVRLPAICGEQNAELLMRETKTENLAWAFCTSERERGKRTNDGFLCARTFCTWGPWSTGLTNLTHTAQHCQQKFFFNDPAPFVFFVFVILCDCKTENCTKRLHLFPSVYLTKQMSHLTALIFQRRSPWTTGGWRVEKEKNASIFHCRIILMTLARGQFKPVWLCSTAARKEKENKVMEALAAFSRSPVPPVFPSSPSQSRQTWQPEPQGGR